MHAGFHPAAPFEGARCIAAGELADVALKAKAVADTGEQVLIFDDAKQRNHRGGFPRNRRGRVATARARTAGCRRRRRAPRGPGRPKLGVVAREITLLPRHWDWLNAQPGGASVALRKLVDEARRANEGKTASANRKRPPYWFMSITGWRPSRLRGGDVGVVRGTARSASAS